MDIDSIGAYGGSTGSVGWLNGDGGRFLDYRWRRFDYFRTGLQMAVRRYDKRRPAGES